MARSKLPAGLVALLVCSTFAYADISPTAQIIRDQLYMQLSSKNPVTTVPLGSIGAGEIQKASGIVPSVGDGLVAWADGRKGIVCIMGYDLLNPAQGEFLMSYPADTWQEGNPFVGVNHLEAQHVAYDAAQVGVAGGDPGNIWSTSYPGLVVNVEIASGGLQRSPVFTVPTAGQTYLAWVDYPGTLSQFPGEANRDIWATDNGVTLKNLTLSKPAPRNNLAADNRYLVWQELVMHDPILETSSWDIVVYDLGGTYASDDLRFRYFNGPAAGKNQIDPDISGSLVVWTQEEDPSGTMATNIYFKDLDSAVGPLAITTVGTAAKAAISKVVVAASEPLESYFVVWQDYRLDSTQVFYAGGHGGWDYTWDIWAQELRRDAGTGEWALYMDAFLIRSDAGRQTNPDIWGLDVVWQSQAPGVEDIYVWGPPIPEPATMLMVVGGVPILLAVRRRRARQNVQ